MMNFAFKMVILMQISRLGVEPGELLYVGDHGVDATAAARARVGGFIGVLSGATTEAQLLEAAAVDLPAAEPAWAPRLLTVLPGAGMVPAALGMTPGPLETATFMSTATPIRMPPTEASLRTWIDVRVPGHATENRLALIDM